MKTKGMEDQEAADWNNAQTLYRIVRDLTGAHGGRSVPIQDKNG